MPNDRNSADLFCDYYKQWIEVYKKDAIREATLAKYQMTQKDSGRGYCELVWCR